MKYVRNSMYNEIILCSRLMLPDVHFFLQLTSYFFNFSVRFTPKANALFYVN